MCTNLLYATSYTVALVEPEVESQLNKNKQWTNRAGKSGKMFLEHISLLNVPDLCNFNFGKIKTVVFIWTYSNKQAEILNGSVFQTL